jgi:hypothetical protein
MHKTTRLARSAIAAAALFIVGSAFAEGTFTPELGFGQTSGKHVLAGDGTERSRDPAFLAAFGYELDNGLGARVMAIGDFNVQTAFGPNSYRTFDNFVGVQATGKYALGNQLALRGGLGIGRSNLVGDGHELVIDGIVSVGLQWRPASHYAMEARFDHLTKTGTNVIGLQFQVPF